MLSLSSLFRKGVLSVVIRFKRILLMIIHMVYLGRTMVTKTRRTG